MQNLIESLLNYSRTGSSDRLFVKTDLNVLLDEVKSTLQDAVEEKNIVIESDKLPTMEVIPHQFTQLLLNLLSNSIKYRKPGAALLVQIKAEKVKAGDHPGVSEASNTDIWKISVADNGIGFEPEYERKVFELFQRLHGRDEYSGTGIGLAICKKIVQNHHGSITAKGRPGVGATFTIYLPENHIPA
ncbi:ATPase/histidine kinase/DNA gyrase B/HSP90 domain protein [Ostertagia ostertagi]